MVSKTIGKEKYNHIASIFLFKQINCAKFYYSKNLTDYILTMNNSGILPPSFSVSVHRFAILLALFPFRGIYNFIQTHTPITINHTL